jgi:hypothetical protein
MKYVYMVLFDWSTTDDEAVEVELFDSYRKAHERFCEIILNERNPDMSWVAEGFEINGYIKDGYIFDHYEDPTCGDNLWWNITDENDYNIHSFLDLKAMEVQ